MRKLTVSVDDFTASFLESTGNASGWIRQAARRAALAEAGRAYGGFEKTAGLTDTDHAEAMLRLHAGQAEDGGTAA